MKIVLLDIDESLRNLIKPDSMINNYSEFNLFYFSIPTNLSMADQNHLKNQSFLFFQSQFSERVEINISVQNKSDVRNNIKHAKELTWEIFYRLNSWVRVCDGIYDEELDWFISGFTGKIIDFYSNEENSVFLISFSGDAISKIPLEHLKKNIDNKISSFYTILESDLIMPDNVPENISEDEQQRIELMLRLINFPEFSSGEKYDNLSDLLQYWKNEFIEITVNPIEVRINSLNQSKYHLIDLPYFDDRFGVWCTLISDDIIIDVPINKIIEVKNNKTFDELIVNYKKVMAIALPN